MKFVLTHSSLSSNHTRRAIFISIICIFSISSIHFLEFSFILSISTGWMLEFPGYSFVYELTKRKFQEDEKGEAGDFKVISGKEYRTIFLEAWLCEMKVFFGSRL